jgi:hypothetical protein
MTYSKIFYEWCTTYVDNTVLNVSVVSIFAYLDLSINLSFINLFEFIFILNEKAFQRKLVPIMNRKISYEETKTKLLLLNRESLLKLTVPTYIFSEMIDTKCVLFNVLILTLDLDKRSIRVNHLNRRSKKR